MRTIAKYWTVQSSWTSSVILDNWTWNDRVFVAMHLNISSWCPSIVLFCAVVAACELVWRLQMDTRFRPDVRTDERRKAIAYLEARVQFLEGLLRVRRVEIARLSDLLTSILRFRNVTATDGTASLKTVNSSFPPHSNYAKVTSVKNVGHQYPLVLKDKPALQLPSVYYFLPHLLEHPSSLQPSVWLSRGRSGVSVILGIITRRRDVKNSLILPLRNMFNNMSPQEADDTLIVVLIGEIDHKYVEDVCKRLVKLFLRHVESGLLEVISPPAAYYPGKQYFDAALDDPSTDTVRRSKRNLDLAFLMMYSQEKGSFYVQLDEYTYTKNHFVSTMKNYALNEHVKKSPWLTIDFSRMGVIGKLFKAIDLPRVIHFFLMFHNNKSPNWLLNHLVVFKVCRRDEPHEICIKKKSKHMLKFPMNLFHWNIFHDFRFQKHLVSHR